MDDSRIAIVGRGRAGHAFAAAARAAGMDVYGPVGRDLAIPFPMTTLLCVPDSAIAEVAQRIPVGMPVGHCSASQGLAVLNPHEAFSFHPLLSLQGEHSTFANAWAAVDGTTPRARALSESLATRFEMRVIHVPADKRALYHASASVAANYLVTLEDTAERLASECGVPREALLPLVTTALKAWSQSGFANAITGPVARGDEATVAVQRSAIEEFVPDALSVFDALTVATRRALNREQGQ